MKLGMRKLKKTKQKQCEYMRLRDATESMYEDETDLESEYEAE